MADVHVVPVNDLVEHTPNDCVCVPTTEPVMREDGSNGWLVTHHSLDGREHRERVDGGNHGGWETREATCADHA